MPADSDAGSGGYFATVRSMTTDPVLLAAVDKAEAAQRCKCAHLRGWHSEPMVNGELCCSECGCDDFEPILNS